MGWINGGSRLHYALWGELGVDYIFAFCYMGRIKGGLHFKIFVNGVDYILAFCYMGRIKGGLHFELLYMGWITILDSSQWGGFSVDYT